MTISPSVNGNGDLTGVYFIYNLLAINILCIFIYNYLCFIIDLYNIINTIIKKYNLTGVLYITTTVSGCWHKQ